MTPSVKDFGKCGCGRSPQGGCRGWHALSPEDWEAQKADLLNRALMELLSKNVCEITFTKVNGETRTMPCTLKSELMPPVALKEHHQTRLYKPETLSVWCTDKSEWRSFRVANVTGVAVLP